MNAIPQTPFTMDDMRKHENERRNRAFGAFKDAGLSSEHAAVLDEAQRKLSAALGLATLLRHDAMLTESADEGQELGMGGYLRGCVESAQELLLHDIYRALAKVGKEP